MAAPALLPAESAAVLPPEAAATHPQLAAAQAGAQLASERLKLAQASVREAPSLALRLVRDRTEASEAYGQSVGIKLTWPLSFGPRVRQEHASARADLLQADAEQELAQRKLALTRERAQRDGANAKQQMAQAEQRVALSADNLALAEKSFALGESDLPGLLRARAAAFDAQAVLSRQQLSLAAAQSRINQSLGVMP